MADNVAITAGSGTDIAADDIGGVKYQRVKVVMGADGAADMDLDSGQQAMANSLPVVIASNQSAVPVSASSLPLPSGAATSALQGGGLPAALGAGGGLKIDGSGTPVPVTAAQSTHDNLQGNANIQVANTDVSTSNPVPTKPFSALLEGGLTELVGINEQVDQNDYSGSVEVALGGTYSGEIVQFCFYATEDGTGGVQDSAGILFIFDADPSISSGDTSMTAAERVTVIGKVYVNAEDWDTDANGGTAFIYNQPVAFHAVSSLFFVWKHTDATSLNDAAGDDEQLEFNFHYRRES